MDNLLFWFFGVPLISGAIIVVLSIISMPFVMLWERFKK